MRTVIFATRPSKLARVQTQSVMVALQKAWDGLDCRELIVTTQGDRILDRPLPEIGGKGLFTSELEAGILTGRVHAAVHSLKDLPIDIAEGLTLGAIPVRADVRDVLFSRGEHTLETLPSGACVGTSSLRRKAQLLTYRPDLIVKPIRGNVDTRVQKVLDGQYDAIVLAAAGLTRLGLEAYIDQWLPLEIMLPAPGQAALAVKCQEGGELLEYLAPLDDPKTRITTTAERSFLASLGGGCSLPVAAHADMDGAEIVLTGLVASTDGKRAFRVLMRGEDPELLGAEAAQQILTQGAAEVLGP